MPSIYQYQCGEFYFKCATILGVRKTYAYLFGDNALRISHLFLIKRGFHTMEESNWILGGPPMVAVSIQYFLAFYPSRYIRCFMCLAFGAFMFSISFMKSLIDELHKINNMTSNKKSRKHMLENLSKFIRNHADLKQLSDWPTHESQSWPIKIIELFLTE